MDLEVNPSTSISLNINALYLNDYVSRFSVSPICHSYKVILHWAYAISPRYLKFMFVFNTYKSHGCKTTY